MRNAFVCVCPAANKLPAAVAIAANILSGCLTFMYGYIWVWVWVCASMCACTFAAVTT